MARVPQLFLITASRHAENPADALDSLEPEALCQRYAAFVAAIALRLLGRDEEVEDAIQDSFAAALRDIGQVREPSAVKAWLAKVTVRVCYRRMRTRRMRSLLGLARPAAYENIAAPELSVEDRIFLARIYTWLDELPAAERIAWILRYVQGETLESVAELCQCSLATAKRRILAVNQAIKRRLGHA